MQGHLDAVTETQGFGINSMLGIGFQDRLDLEIGRLRLNARLKCELTTIKRRGCLGIQT